MRGNGDSVATGDYDSDGRLDLYSLDPKAVWKAGSARGRARAREVDPEARPPAERAVEPDVADHHTATGKTDRKALLDYVETLGSFEGVGKNISFEANGNIKATGVFVYEVKGGKLTVLGTTEELAR